MKKNDVVTLSMAERRACLLYTSERKEGWTASRNESVVAEIKSAFFSGEEEKCGELMEGVLGKLEEEYRDYVVQ